MDDFRFIFAYAPTMSRYTKAKHRVDMQFVRRALWHVTFLEPGLQTPLPRKLAFKDEGKIRGTRGRLIKQSTAAQKQ